MKKNLLFIAVLSAIITVPAMAAVKSYEITEPENMINAGYSQSTTEDVFMLKNRATSKPIEPLYEHSNNIIIKTWKGLWSYLDPSRESNDRLHHDITIAPSYTDL